MSSPLTDKINALTAYANEVTGESDTTLSDAVASLADGYGQGGIANGIIITAKDNDGYPTAVDIYGDLWPYALSYKGANGSSNLSFQKTTSVRLMTNQTVLTEGCFRYIPLETIDGLDKITTIAAHVFRGTTLTSLSLPLVTKIDYDSPFSEMTLLKTVNIPLATGGMSGGTYSNFQNDTALETVVLGSVGHGLYRSSSTANNAFSGCTQSGLTITVYTRSGDDVDNLVTAVRNGATNATIVIKASANTTYNNVSYNAGDTLITSTP